MVVVLVVAEEEVLFVGWKVGEVEVESCCVYQCWAFVEVLEFVVVC